MRLQALVLCSDENILRVLRRVLSDLEIVIDHSAESDSAIHKLTRQRYQAVIVDSANETAASQVLRSARTAPCNKRAVTVAILDGQKAMHSALDLGAHFVLYKPISAERAKASFRAARALMKRERRRNVRVPVQIPVTLALQGGGQQRMVTSDVSEGGIAVQPAPSGKEGPMTVTFMLPGADYKIECRGEVAWANATRQAGIRFMDLASEAKNQLKVWLETQVPDLDHDDPPISCKLTDLSPNAAYLETSAPFPVRTRVVLSLNAAQPQVRVEGMVRVTHPEKGMGVEFVQGTAPQREEVEKFIQALIHSKGVLPGILVQLEGLEASEAKDEGALPAGENSDPLLHLFCEQAGLNTEEFLIELRRRRGSPEPEHRAASA
jgi:CheY-like chemotaxis protein